MKQTPVIAIFDIGKTNKKFFLFDQQYKIVLERTVCFEEIVDEDGFACDNLKQMVEWVQATIREILLLQKFIVKALNFSAYGASFVHINRKGDPIMPLYNYLKPFPPALQKQFYDMYGGERKLSVATASPVLGNLNSGMQLYWLKHEQKELFDRIHYSLHLPQYLSYLVTGKAYSDITSIGCHTGLWNFKNNTYHDWVQAENIDSKLAPVFPSNECFNVTLNDKSFKTGVGLHDSSAALIPYLASFSEPFVLISTGTWCISLNPFNHDPLTAEELQQDCLCYMGYNAQPVKASRLFAGHEHEQQVKALAQYFNVSIEYYKQVIFDQSLLSVLSSFNGSPDAGTGLQSSLFAQRTLESFDSYEQAYHQLMYDIIQQQKMSTSLVLNKRRVARIFVDGGFAKNAVYMHLLAAAFPEMEVFSASVSQATAIGAALAIHPHWNVKPIPGDMVELKYYTVTQ